MTTKLILVSMIIIAASQTFIWNPNGPTNVYNDCRNWYGLICPDNIATINITQPDNATMFLPGLKIDVGNTTLNGGTVVLVFTDITIGTQTNDNLILNLAANLMAIGSNIHIDNLFLIGTLTIDSTSNLTFGNYIQNGNLTINISKNGPIISAKKWTIFKGTIILNNDPYNFSNFNSDSQLLIECNDCSPANFILKSNIGENYSLMQNKTGLYVYNSAHVSKPRTTLYILLGIGLGIIITIIVIISYICNRRNMYNYSTV